MLSIDRIKRCTGVLHVNCTCTANSTKLVSISAQEEHRAKDTATQDYTSTVQAVQLQSSL